jgi:hypothetical protein
MIETLQKIQSELKAPKNQTNTFGKYKYRSCEDILEAVKPVLANYSAAIVISDEMVAVGDRIYVKATATIYCGDNSATATAYAREGDNKKGMDDAQLTGATSSYARKYALNGLLCIDDTKDADATNDHGKAPQQQRKPAAPKPSAIDEKRKESIKDLIKSAGSLEQVEIHETKTQLERSKWPDAWQKGMAQLIEARKAEFGMTN